MATRALIGTSDAMTFEQLCKDAACMGPLTKGSLADQVDDAIDQARVNADDTVHVEKSAPASDWDRVALGSLRSVLTSGECSRSVTRWFRARGVEG